VWEGRALVKTSASWLVDEIGSNFISPNCNRSLIMWQSISRCFVRSWNNEFVAMCNALWLSQYKGASLE